MKIAQYDPWNVLAQLRKDFDNLYNRAPNGQNDEYTTVATSSWIPAIDIQETDKAFIIHADVPGVDPQKIEVTMEGGVLTIKGERTVETATENKTYKRTERVQGSFYRRFSLPDSADAEKIAAHSKNGVLEVTIPKREVAQPRKISVNVE